MQKKLKVEGLINCDFLNKKLGENNIDSLKPVQIESLKHENGNIFIESPTGSGKTLAYLLPIFKYLIENPCPGLKALIVAPTRELSKQIASVVINYGFKCTLSYDKELNEDIEILIATPGVCNFLKNAKYFKELKFLVLDEGDKLYNEFSNSINSILKNKFKRIFVISATLNKLEELIKTIDPVFIKSTDFFPQKLENNFIKTSPLNKYDYLQFIIEKYLNGKVIVFFNTCASVDFFYSLFVNLILKNHEGISLMKLHGKLDLREKIFAELLIKDTFILFCTDIAARGIDIENIDCVIHFDIPLDPSNTIHRSGRTARNNKCGVSYLFVMPSELPFIKFLEFKKIVIHEKVFNVTNLDYEKLKSFVSGNTEIEKGAVKAFVSYLASYKEYVLNYLIEVKKLDFDSLAELFCLRKIPKMPELKHVVFKKYLRKKK